MMLTKMFPICCFFPLLTDVVCARSLVSELSMMLMTQTLSTQRCDPLCPVCDLGHRALLCLKPEQAKTLNKVWIQLINSIDHHNKKNNQSI